MLHNLFGFLVPKSSAQQEAEAQRALLREAARIGGAVFGPIPEGVRREFFCLDEHTWVWHEEWTDDRKIHHARTTRYDVRPHGIFKAQDGQPYHPIGRQEILNFYNAVNTYGQTVDAYFLPRLAHA